MRTIDVFWGKGPKRNEEPVSCVTTGKRLMFKKLREGYDNIVMYDQRSFEKGHPQVNDDPQTICYFFRNGQIKSEKL